MTMAEPHIPAALSSERPWGHFDQFATNEPVTVKIITVEPGHRLSLQRHHLRGGQTEEPLGIAAQEFGRRFPIAFIDKFHLQPFFGQRQADFATEGGKRKMIKADHLALPK